MVGSIGGGWFPSYFMARGDKPYDGRMKAMLVIALFPLVETRSWPWITLGILVGLSLNSVCYGPMAAMFTELFSTGIRCSGVSLAYQLGAIVGGGVAPIIATALFARYHSNLWVSFYMAGACGISLICANRLTDAHDTDLDRPLVAGGSALSTT